MVFVCRILVGVGFLKKYCDHNLTLVLLDCKIVSAWDGRGSSSFFRSILKGKIKDSRGRIIEILKYLFS